MTLTADERQRVVLPDAKPGQVFSYEPQADGAVVLVPVKSECKEAFPPGSLNDVVDDFNREWAGVSPVVPVPPGD